MTSGPKGLDLAEVSKSFAPQVLDAPAAPGSINEKNEKHLTVADEEPVYASDGSLRGPEGEEYPTAEEVDTLRRVCGTVPWSAYTIAFVELCERFSYYGTTIVCKSRAKSSNDRNGYGGIKANRSTIQSSISFKGLSQMDQPLVLLAPTDSLAHWAWASEHRPV